MSWHDLLEEAGGDARSLRIFEGRIAETPTDINQKITAYIPAFDSDQEWGPAPWDPRFRILPDGTLDVLLPEEGDRCLICLAESPDPGEPEVWIAQYWPYD